MSRKFARETALESKDFTLYVDSRNTDASRNGD